MKQGHIDGIDRIDAIAQRIALMTENPTSIVRAYTACGVSAVELNRQTRALECFAKADEFNQNEKSQYNILHYLFASLAYARDGQVEMARSYLDRIKKIENAETSIHYKTFIKWAQSEALQAEGDHETAYRLLRECYAKREREKGRELGNVSKSMRLYAEEQIELRNKKADLVVANSALKDKIIQRQRILFYAGLVIFSFMILAVLYQFRMSRKLRLARQQANAAKSEFLANMFHEISTPMNGVLGMIQVLRQSKLNEDQQSWANTIYKFGRNLMDVLNDILDFSKIEAGQLEIFNQPMNIKSLVEEVVTLLSPLAEEKYISLSANYLDESSFDVIVDDGRLRQVLTNLIANAIKFTLEGSVQVTLDVRTQGNKNQLSLSVKDTGISIEVDKLALIFEGFQQAENSTTRRFGGSGLGLTICQQLVEAMGLPRYVPDMLGRETPGSHTSENSADPGIKNSEISNLASSDPYMPPIRILVDTARQSSREFADQIARHNAIKTSPYTDLKTMIQSLKQAASQGEPFDYLFPDHPIQGKSGLAIAKAISENQQMGDVKIVMSKI